MIGLQEEENPFDVLYQSVSTVVSLVGMSYGEHREPMT